jgi:hypothetical protein
VSETFLGMPAPPHAPRGVGHLRGDESFPDAARSSLADTQLRANIGKATRTIRGKRARVVGELDDWEQLRVAGERIKDDVLANLDRYLVELEAGRHRPRRARALGSRRHRGQRDRRTARARGRHRRRWSRSSRWPPRRSA